MRPYPLRHFLTAVIVVAAVLPASAWAGLYFNLGFGLGCGGCGLSFASCLCPPCGRCYARPSGCACPPPAGPVLQSSYVPQNFVTYRDVPRVEFRRQAYVERVPVTTYQNVTETVYVPQQVTRSVPRTVMTEQTRYRDVAYQTTHRVAQTHTRLVPQTTVGFSPVAPASGCSTCGQNSIGFAPNAVPGYPGVLPAASPAIVSPSPVAIPSMPAITVSPYSSPSVVPEYDDVGWHDVRPRSSRLTRRSHAPVRGASMFRPAPTAATVWQSRF